MDVNKVLIDAYIKEECYHFEDDEIIDNITKYLELFNSTFETGEIVIKSLLMNMNVCLMNLLLLILLMISSHYLFGEHIWRSIPYAS